MSTTTPIWTRRRAPYIAEGITQQGRLTPTRQTLHDDFDDTYPTGPMPFIGNVGDCGAAHAAGALDDDDDRLCDGAGVLLWPLAVIAVVAFVSLVTVLP